MGRLYDAIDESLRVWIERQPIYFVATAPSGADGHVNLSPKGGIHTFRVLGPTTVAYVDFVGSGIETAAHLRDNGRIVLMFCAVDGAPKIVRLYGLGRVLNPGDAEFADLLVKFAPTDDVNLVVRGVVVVDVTRIADSCGFGVPLMDYVGERDQLFRWAAQRQAKDGDGWKQKYQRAKNAVSIDGLAGFDPGAEPTDGMAVRREVAAGTGAG